MAGQKQWATRTLLTHFANAVKAATGEDPMDPESPVRDETVGDIITVLINHDYGIATVPGQMKLGEEPDAKK